MLLNRLQDWLTTKHWLVGASLTRISLGGWAVYYYILHFPVRQVLWGPQALWSYGEFIERGSRLNVWRLGVSQGAADAIYLLGIIVAIAFTVGYRTRLAGALHWFMIRSLQDRTPFVGDGGDNIMRIMLLFLILVDAGAYFSYDARHQSRRVDADAQSPRNQVLAVLHNIGVLLMIGQLSLLYMSTGLYKVMGEVWQNGTALYYVLRVDEFTWPGVADFIYRNPYLVVGGTYGTVLFELLFAPALLNRVTRYMAMAAGTFFHTSIAAVMGLVTFGWSMLSYYPVLISDAEYAAFAQRLGRRLSLTVLYDGCCPFCIRSIRFLERLDAFALIRFVSFRTRELLDTPGIDPKRIEKRIHVVDAGGRISEGIDAMLQIVLRSPLLWPSLPFLFLSRLLQGQAAYDRIASRRFLLMPGACDTHCVLTDDSGAHDLS